jgi:hypothetical protein
MKIFLSIIAAGVIFIMGASLAVFPVEHPQGIIGISLQKARDFLSPPGLVDTRPELEKTREIYNLKHNEVSLTVSISEEVVTRKVIGRSLDEIQGTLLTLGGAYDYFDFGMKPSIYLQKVDVDKILALYGDGSFLSLTVAGDVRAKSIPTNILDFLPSEISQPNWFSIKGLLVDDTTVYVSFTNKNPKASNCWSTDVISAPLSLDELNFRTFWKNPGCVNQELVSEFNAHQSGGGMASLPGGRLALAIGDYRSRHLSQLDYSLFGKVLSIRKSDANSYRVIAKGLRNPQSLSYDGAFLWVTDQGPKGGDELNVLDPNLNSDSVNFGWPMRSAGSHYDAEYREEAPLNLSSEVFVLREPVRSWTPSIGISSVTADSDEMWGGGGGVVVGSLGSVEGEENGSRSLHILSCNPILNVCTPSSSVLVEDRVRSFVTVGTSLFIALDSGKILVLSNSDLRRE